MIVLYIALVFIIIPFIWPHRWLVRDGKRYLLRFPLKGGDGLKRAPLWLGRQGTNLFLHVIVMSDGSSVHSHPWWADAYILWGRYRDSRQYKLTSGWSEMHAAEYGPGDWNFIDDRAYHTLTLLSRFVITLCWTGPKHGRGWYFKIGDELVNASGRGPAAYDEAHEPGAK